jgi:hypothetical protein
MEKANYDLSDSTARAKVTQRPLSLSCPLTLLTPSVLSRTPLQRIKTISALSTARTEHSHLTYTYLHLSHQHTPLYLSPSHHRPFSPTPPLTLISTPIQTRPLGPTDRRTESPKADTRVRGSGEGSGVLGAARCAPRRTHRRAQQGKYCVMYLLIIL